jgi:hypothetical protein
MRLGLSECVTGDEKGRWGGVGLGVEKSLRIFPNESRSIGELHWLGSHESRGEMKLRRHTPPLPLERTITPPGALTEPRDDCSSFTLLGSDGPVSTAHFCLCRARSRRGGWRRKSEPPFAHATLSASRTPLSSAPDPSSNEHIKRSSQRAHLVALPANCQSCIGGALVEAARTCRPRITSQFSTSREGGGGRFLRFARLFSPPPPAARPITLQIITLLRLTAD